MTKFAYIDNNGISDIFTEKFDIGFRNLVCVTRKKDVAKRLSLVHKMLEQGIPLNTALLWAQNGDGTVLTPFALEIIGNNLSLIMERGDYADILFEAGYSESSVALWTLFGDKVFLSKEEV